MIKRSLFPALVMGLFSGTWNGLFRDTGNRLSFLLNKDFLSQICYFDSPQLSIQQKQAAQNFRLLIERYAQFLEEGLGIVSPPHFVYDFSRKCLPRYALLTNQTFLSECLYFSRYSAICVLQLLDNI